MSLSTIAAFDAVAESPNIAGQRVWFERSSMNQDCERYYVEPGDMVCSSREQAMCHFPRSTSTVLPGSAVIKWVGGEKHVGILELLGGDYVRWFNT